MAEGISKSDLEDVFAKFFGGGGGGGGGGKPMSLDPKSVEEFKKSIKESTKTLKEQNASGKAYEAMFRGHRQSMQDATKEFEALDKQIEELAKTAQNSNDRQAVYELQKERDAKMNVDQSLRARVAVMNLGVSAGEVATSMIKSAFQYAKDLQGGASGVEAGSAAAERAARTTGDAVSSVGQAFQAFGPILGTLFKQIPFLGPIITGVGIAMDIFGKKAADVSEAGLNFLGEELKKTQKAFKDINDTGAVFGGGMTEMRNVAAGAGLDITQLAAVVRASKDDLSLMGMGLGEATKRLAGVSKELRTSDLGIQLRKLGYSAEEQAELSAGVMANMNAAGVKRAMSDKELAETTVQYGKDLKVLADVTGKDAKQAAEKARTESLKAAVYGKLTADQRTALQGVLRAMPETLQKGFLEKIVSGGGAITDVATNVAGQANQQIGTSFDTLYGTVMAGSKDASDAQAIALREAEKMGAAQLQANKTNNEMYAANVLAGGNAVLAGASDIGNKLTEVGVKQVEGVSAQAEKNAEAAKKNLEPLDVAVAKVEENAQKLRAAMGEQLTGPITTFAKTMALGGDTVAQALEKLGVKIKEKGFNEKFGEAAGGAAGGVAAGALAGGLVGSIVPVVGTAIGAAVGGLLGAWGGSALGGSVGKMFDEPVKMGNGGIVSGPTQALIGEAGLKEAVIPLPNGRSVPLDLDLSSITNATVAALKSTPSGMMAGAAGNMLGAAAAGGSGAASDSVMQEQVSLLREIREVLSNSKDLQQQYVYNTYN